MLMVILYLLSFLVPLAILAALIGLVVWIIKHFSGNKSDKPKRGIGLKEVYLVCLIGAATMTGLAGILLIPRVYFDIENVFDSSSALFIYLFISMIILIGGIALKKLTGKFLMLLSVFLLLISVVPLVASAGQGAGFLAVLVAFGVLVGLIIKSNNKANHG